MTPGMLVALGVFGLMTGSFLNVVISRVPAGESVVAPRSRCPKCRKLISWYDNVPVVSFLLLSGRCRSCNTPISSRYPAIEFVTAIAFVLQGIVFANDPLMLIDRLVFTGLLIALFGTDLETMRLPNVLTLPGIAVGIAFSAFLPPGLQSSLIGAAIGAAIPWTIRWAWHRLRGVEAMGLGDVKMLAMIGAFLGWRQVWLVLFVASLLGAVVGIVLTMSRRRSMASRLPFGTFLAVAAYVASLSGEPLLKWYLALYE
jgi:leader peptidase (prepilin peptidase)/N-methyltransferase